MKDVELYRTLLGLEAPWRVKAVRLEVSREEIEVEVECDQSTWVCPQCQKAAHRHGSEQRRWRHLDSCQFKTFVVAAVPRVKCDEHGTATVQVPWAEGRSRFSALFERLAIDVLLQTSVQGACKLLRISWDQADGIKQRAVQRGLARKPLAPIRRLCVDEKGVGGGHRYLTVVLNADDPDGATVEYIGEGRGRESLEAFWRSRSAEQLQAVEAVAMDLLPAYKHVTLECVPGAAEKIVHDPFHLMRHMNDAVNEVRRQDHPILGRLPRLKGLNTRQMWLYGYENLPERYHEPLAFLRRRMRCTARAWEIKELLREFFRCASYGEACEFFKRWYGWAIRSRLHPVKCVARMLKKNLRNILTFFRHRLTTAPSEAINSVLAGLIKKACGYRNRERFKTDAFFHAGGLDLYPVSLNQIPR
jgi:transposase